jgi:hypothetical protein
MCKSQDLGVNWMEAMVNAIYSESEETINKQVMKLQPIVADQEDEMECLVVRINSFFAWILKRIRICIKRRV